jgi:purine-nucleoside phosphorylase
VPTDILYVYVLYNDSGVKVSIRGGGMGLKMSSIKTNWPIKAATQVKKIERIVTFDHFKPKLEPVVIYREAPEG